MNGWAQARGGGVWHQVVAHHDEIGRSGIEWMRVWFPCMNKYLSLPAGEVRDYRAIPTQRCRKAYCQREVEA